MHKDGARKTIDIKPPTMTLAPEEFDPMQSKRAQEVLKPLREICFSLPETSEDTQFGNPVWRAAYFQQQPRSYL